MVDLGLCNVGYNDEVRLLMVMDKILYLEDRVGIPVNEFVTMTMHMTIGLSPPRLELANTAGEVQAVIDDSRWIVHCPNPMCNGALYASRDLPFFCCVDCGSPENGGLWYKVVYPQDSTAIEIALLARPRVAKLKDGRLVGRGWDPGQTVDDLVQENRELGIGD